MKSFTFALLIFILIIFLHSVRGGEDPTHSRRVPSIRGMSEREATINLQLARDERQRRRRTSSQQQHTEIHHNPAANSSSTSSENQHEVIERPRLARISVEQRYEDYMSAATPNRRNINPYVSRSNHRSSNPNYPQIKGHL
ncbi:uncharacterized protein LOC117176430 [Belonocnema kinseyi]|uniref:uncharacterized protein LOC117176430 n=1 Tax=Belonocnema kinseyi TaxID=2817044 RepID=UPI00143CD97F|nr:uncharacterized protein LOC117176430 [Belonocnema kinseyi]